MYFVNIKNKSLLVIIRFLFVVLIIFAATGFRSAPEDKKCTNWSDSYNGVYFRYCQSDKYATYYNELQWYNGNSYKVYISWKWYIDKDTKGQSGIYLDNETYSDYSAIAQGYQIQEIKVERN